MNDGVYARADIKTLPAHYLAGVRTRDAPYSSRRAPDATRGLGRPSLDARSGKHPGSRLSKRKSGVEEKRCCGNNIKLKSTIS